MSTNFETTSFLTNEEALAARKWHIVDAAGKPVGRVATAVATLLRGKNKPSYTPHNACGDYVVIINAAQVVLTGNKAEDKLYHHHTAYFGGLKTATARQLMDRTPERVLEYAINGMLPGGKLSRRIKTQLKVYAGAEHPHGSQKPEPYEIKTNKK